jgi:hypothetical protein
MTMQLNILAIKYRRINKRNKKFKKINKKKVSKELPVRALPSEQMGFHDHCLRAHHVHHVHHDLGLQIHVFIKIIDQKIVFLKF